MKISGLLENTPFPFLPYPPFSFPSSAAALLSKAKNRLEKLKNIPRACLSLPLHLKSSSCPHMVGFQLYSLLVLREHTAVVGLSWGNCPSMVPLLCHMIPRKVQTREHLSSLFRHTEGWRERMTVMGTRTQIFRL